jgi:hypothetical protein
MTKKIFLCAFLALLLVGQANATLTSLGNGMVFDDVRNLTWYETTLFDSTHYWDAGAVGPPAISAAAWVHSLNVGGYTDWRLPSAFNHDGTGPSAGNSTDNELGYLFYTELGNGTNPAMTNTGPFQYLGRYTYWTGTPVSGWLFYAWAYDFYNNSLYQAGYTTSLAFPVMAVRNGGPGPTPTPEPITLILLGLGLAGLVGVRRLNK